MSSAGQMKTVRMTIVKKFVKLCSKLSEEFLAQSNILSLMFNVIREKGKRELFADNKT